MEQLANVLTNPTFWSNTPMFILLVVIFVILLKVLKVRVNTGHIQIGGEPREAFYERKIVQEQCDFAHAYLMGLLGKIETACADHKLLYDGWMTKCILEYAYDEFVNWIHYNHITDNEAYITTKQNKICSLIYAQPVRDEFKTPEFQERMCNWVKEIIIELVRIRKVYTEEMKKGNL